MQNLKWATAHLSRRLGAGRATRGAGRAGCRRAAWAHLGTQAGLWAVGCALDALSLFLIRFDSVLFLSKFLDIVRERGS